MHNMVINDNNNSKNSHKINGKDSDITEILHKMNKRFKKCCKWIHEI